MKRKRTNFGPSTLRAPEEVIWQCLFPKLSQPCYGASIKTDERESDGSRCWEAIRVAEKVFSDEVCCKRSLRAAPRKELRAVK